MSFSSFSVEAHNKNKIAIVHKEGHRVEFHIALNGDSQRIVSPAFQVIENKTAATNWSPFYDIAAYTFATDFARKNEMLD